MVVVVVRSFVNLKSLGYDQLYQPLVLRLGASSSLDVFGLSPSRLRPQSSTYYMAQMSHWSLLLSDFLLDAIAYFKLGFRVALAGE